MKEEEDIIITSKNHIYNTSPSLILKEEKRYKEPKKYNNSIQLISPSKIDLKFPGLDYKIQNKINNRKVFSINYPIQNSLKQDRFNNNYARSFNSFEFKNKLNEKLNSFKSQNLVSPKNVRYIEAFEAPNESANYPDKTPDKGSFRTPNDIYRFSKESNTLLLKQNNPKEAEFTKKIYIDSNINTEFFQTANDFKLLEASDKSIKNPKVPTNQEKNNLNLNKETIYKTLTDNRSTEVTNEDFGTQINFENDCNTQNESLTCSQKFTLKKKLKNKESILNKYNLNIGSSTYIGADSNQFENKVQRESNINNFINKNTINNDRSAKFIPNNNLIVSINNLNANNLINFNKFYNENNKSTYDNEINLELIKTDKVKKNICFSPLNKSNYKDNVYGTLYSKSPTFYKGKSSFTSFTTQTKHRKDIKNSGIKNYMNTKDIKKLLMEVTFPNPDKRNIFLYKLEQGKILPSIK